MKDITIRSAISILILFISYGASEISTLLSLPQAFVAAFIITQCLNEYLVYSRLAKKDQQILSLKRSLKKHHDAIDNIYDEDKRPKEEKEPLRVLKHEMLKTITYDITDDDIKKSEEDGMRKSSVDIATSSLRISEKGKRIL